MKKYTKITMLTSVALLTLTLATNNHSVYAADFSQEESQQVVDYQKQYQAIDKSTYSNQNMYDSTPTDTDSGKLNSQYIKTSLDYINYYRKLAGLNAETTTDSANNDAQLAAWALAKVNYPVSKDAHGILNTQKPEGMTDSDWDKAQLASFGNITFTHNYDGSSNPETDVNSPFLDNNNIDGTALTGHRDLLLSARASRIGFGAAIGTNKIKYTVQNGVFADDLLKSNIWADVSFPSKELYPIELLQHENTPWSIYLGNTEVVGTPVITITDKDTGKTYTATNVKNLGRFNWAYGYKTTIDYMPTGVELVLGHEYLVKVGNVYSYSFKLFSQLGNGVPVTKLPQTVTNQKKKPLQIQKSTFENKSNIKSSVKSQLIKSSNAIASQKTLPQTGNKSWLLALMGFLSITLGLAVGKKYN